MGASRKNRRTDYLVQWKGSLESEATWERDVTLWQFEGAVQDYQRGLRLQREGEGLLPPRMPKLVGRMQGPHRYALDL